MPRRRIRIHYEQMSVIERGRSIGLTIDWIERFWSDESLDIWVEKIRQLDDASVRTAAIDREPQQSDCNRAITHHRVRDYPPCGPHICVTHDPPRTTESAEFTLALTVTPLLSHACVTAVAEWSRYRIVAGFVTSSSPVPLKTSHVGERCTLNLSRAQTSSQGVWCGS
ncbi:hypothetical protein TNCV_3649731 [Trichonephila clavipes]|nr:hypothetical protein TNCV_3649731 [Trichonephila clavipes]